MLKPYAHSIRPLLSRLWALLLLAVFITGCLPALAAETQSTLLRVGYFAFDGYHNLSEDGSRSGYGYDLLQLMARYENIHFSYVGYDKNFVEARQMLARGEVDLLTAVSRTPELEELYDFSSRSIGTASTILTIKAGNRDIVSGQYETYNDMSIGLLTDSMYIPELERFAAEKGFRYKAVYYDTMDEMAAALQNGEVDGLFSSSLRAHEDEWSINSFNERPIFVAVRKGDDKTLALVNHALDRMALEEQHWNVVLMQKYYGDDRSRLPFLTSAELEYLTQQKEQNRVYRVLVNPDRYPYSYVEDGKMTGIMIDLFDLIAQRAGIAYEWIIPQDREHYASLISDAGTDICIDLTPDFSQAETRGYSVTDRYLTAPFSWIRRSDNMGDIKTAAKLTYMAYTPAQYAYNSAYHDIRYLTYPTLEECLQSVIDRKTDGLCTYTYQAEQLILGDLSNRLVATASQSENQFAIGVAQHVNKLLTSILNTTINCMEDWEVVDITRRHTNLSSPSYTVTELVTKSPQLATILILVSVLLGVLVFSICQRIQYEKKLKKTIHFQENKLNESLQAVLDVLATAIEFRSSESGEHVQRIRSITQQVLNRLVQLYPDDYALSSDEVEKIAMAAVLHDVGKIAIPDHILNKPGKLSAVEFETIKQHPVKGCEMLECIPNLKDEPLYAYAYDICRWHHERWDGKGYPDGLKGDAIPVWAQVAAVADVYDALTSSRVYKEAYSHEKAVEMILDGECGSFNPKVISAFGDVADHLKKEEKPGKDQFRQAPAGRDPTMLALSAFQCLLNTTSDMVFLKDVDLVFRGVSPAFAALLDRSPEEFVCHTYSELFGFDANARRYELEDRQLLATGEDLVDYLEVLGERNGLPIYGSSTKRLLTDAQGRIMGILGITRDVTSEYFTKKHHQMELKYLFELPEDLFFAVYIDINQWRINAENLHTVSGHSFAPHESIENLVEAALKGMSDRRGPAYSFYHDFTLSALRNLYDSGQSEIVMEYLRRFADGSTRWVRDEIKFLVDPANGHLCLILAVRDIHEQKLAEQKMIERAEHDPLTGLLNRSSLRMLVRETLTKSAHFNPVHALFMLDMDNLKQVNDRLGHREGDAQIIRFAKELKNSFRSSDLVARIGGDEFVVFMRFVSDPQFVKAKAEQLLASLRQLPEAAPDIQISASIGVSLYPEDGKTLEELYEAADKAMYHAKHNGKNNIVFKRDMS